MDRVIARTKSILQARIFWLAIFLFLVGLFCFTDIGFIIGDNVNYQASSLKDNNAEESTPLVTAEIKPLDREAYDKKMIELANNPPPPEPKPIIKKIKDPKTGKITTVSEPGPAPIIKPNIWPVKTVYPNDGAILPFKRIIAYYGNLFSKKMGVLGEYPETEMLAKLRAEVKKWEAADPETPVVPALHYIAVTAQASPGFDKKYRARMPAKEIDKVLAMAKKVNGIVFLDIQVGLSNVESEIPILEKYLKMPEVHLGIDPEFSMKTGKRPGTVIGTFSSSDINYAVNYLSKLVKENNLPPKVLIVHRFTQNMVTGYKEIKPTPEVQVVMDMDGWGGKAKKKNTYQQFIYREPVQFTGFKLFYKNDVKEAGTVLLTPEELLKLNPRPSYIQFQ